MLLEKCEIATATLRMHSNPDPGSSSSSSRNPNSRPQPFDAEVEAFVKEQQEKGKDLLCDDPELDNLMIKTIQVLRIHLLELEKVQDLCKDFCQRYIACLRTKMSSENLLRGTTGFGGSGDGVAGENGSGGPFECSSRSSSPSSDDDSHPTPSFRREAKSHSGKRLCFPNVPGLMFFILIQFFKWYKRLED